MFKNDTTIDQGFNVELFLEDSLHELVPLSRFEPLVLLTASILERQCLVLVLELDHELLLLSFLIKDLIFEEDEDENFVLRVEGVPELRILESKTVKLVLQDTETWTRRQEQVVWLSWLL